MPVLEILAEGKHNLQMRTILFLECQPAPSQMRIVRSVMMKRLKKVIMKRVTKVIWKRVIRKCDMEKKENEENELCRYRLWQGGG